MGLTKIAEIAFMLWTVGWLPLSFILRLAVISQIEAGQHMHATVFVSRTPRDILRPWGRRFLTAHQWVLGVGLASWALLALFGGLSWR